MRKVKRMLCTVCAAVTALCAGSCGLPAEQKEIHEPIELPTNISISWWGNEIRSDYTIRGINEYENLHRNIAVTPYSSDFSGYKENLDALMSCKKEPDIVLINSAWLREYSPDGKGFADMYEYADTINLENFSEDELALGTVNGKLNALPISLNAITFYYNKAVLDKYGLAPPRTWDDLFDCAEVLWKNGVYTLESSYKHYWKMLIARQEQMTGKEAFGSDTFSQEDVVEMFTFFKRLRDSNVIPPEEYVKDNFLAGRTAGVILWVSDAQFYVSPLEEQGGTVVLGEYLRIPIPKRLGWYVKPTSLYAISSNSEHPKEAARFLDYLMNDSRMSELQGTEKGIPLSKSSLETLEAKGMLEGVTYEAASKLKQNMGIFELMPALVEDNERVNAFFELFDLYFYNRITAEEAAAEFIARYPFGEQTFN